RRDDHAEVSRQSARRRDRHRHARHRPGAAADRRTGHGKELVERTSHRGHLRRQPSGRAGDGRYDRGAGPLKLELRPAARRGAVRKIVQIFQERRGGQTLDGKQKVKPPTGVLSTAEAISLFGNSMALAGHFGDGKVSDRDIAAGLHGIVIKEDERDLSVWVEYL